MKGGESHCFRTDRIGMAKQTEHPLPPPPMVYCIPLVRAEDRTRVLWSLEREGMSKQEVIRSRSRDRTTPARSPVCRRAKYTQRGFSGGHGSMV